MLLNHVAYYGVPSSWNCLYITSLHKKGSVLLPDNYRGIAVMSVMAKLYATLLKQRVEEACSKRALRAPM